MHKGNKGLDEEPRYGPTLLPLTLCPVWDRPKSTSETSRPSNCRPWGRLALARATTVGKISSMLQKRRRPHQPSSLTLPWPCHSRNPQDTAQTGTDSLPHGRSLRLSFLQVLLLRGAEWCSGSAAKLCGLSSNPSCIISMPQFSSLENGCATKCACLTGWPCG